MNPRCVLSMKGATFVSLLFFSLAVVGSYGLASGPQAKTASLEAAPSNTISGLTEPQTSGGGISFHVKVRGGLGYLSAGDVNADSFGMMDLWRSIMLSAGWTVSGGYHPLHFGYDFSADVIVQFGRSFGVGVGFGCLGSSRTSLMTGQTTGRSVTFTGTSTLRAVPLRIGAFYTRPFGRNLSLTADAGMDFYVARKFEWALKRAESTAWETFSISAGKSRFLDNLGFHGSLGLEYGISRRMSFFIEAVGRYASLGNFSTATYTDASSSGSFQQAGKIYTQTTSARTIWFVSATPPTAPFGEPKFDFSGFSLQAGLHIRI